MRYLTGDLCLFLSDCEYISGLHQHNMVFLYTHSLSQFRTGFQMLIFTMNRNCILRLCQSIDQLDLFLAGMTGNMCILENNLCTLAVKFIDNIRNRLLIARNRVGTEYNGIPRFNGNFAMCICCHS